MNPAAVVRQIATRCPELSARVVLHAPHPGTKFPFAWAAPGTWR